MKFIGKTPLLRHSKRMVMNIPDNTKIYWNKEKKYFKSVIHNTEIFFPEKFMQYVDEKKVRIFNLKN